MPFTHYRTQGIFLGKEDRGEADQVLTVFTKDFGKLEVLAKAVRKITSKLRSGAEIFYLSEIEFIQGKAHKTLTDAILIDKFNGLRGEPEKLALAYQVADAFDSLTSQEEKDEKIWDLLERAFQELDRCFKFQVSGSMIYYYFLWNLFSLLGYQPELYSCPVCQKELLPETFWFVPQEGGVVCWQCFGKVGADEKKGAEDIAVDTVKVLRIFLKNDWDILPKLKTDDKTQENLKDVSALYLSFLKEGFSKMEK